MFTIVTALTISLAASIGDDDDNDESVATPASNAEGRGLRGGGRDSDANGSKMSRRTGRRRKKPEMGSKNNRTRNGFVDLNFFFPYKPDENENKRRKVELYHQTRRTEKDVKLLNLLGTNHDPVLASSPQAVPLSE